MDKQVLKQVLLDNAQLVEKEHTEFRKRDSVFLCLQMYQNM